jgi:hypothetical protein
VNISIIPQPRADGIAPTPRHHQIRPIILHTGARLAIADGVVEVGGVAWLGQVRRDADTGAFTVAAYVDAGGHGWRAPLGWQADILLSMTDDGGGDDPPPPPAVARRPVALAPARRRLEVA